MVGAIRCAGSLPGGDQTMAAAGWLERGWIVLCRHQDLLDCGFRDVAAQSVRAQQATLKDRNGAKRGRCGQGLFEAGIERARSARQSERARPRKRLVDRSSVSGEWSCRRIRCSGRWRSARSSRWVMCSSGGWRCGAIGWCLVNSPIGSWSGFPAASSTASVRSSFAGRTRARRRAFLRWWSGRGGSRELRSGRWSVTTRRAKWSSSSETCES